MVPIIIATLLATAGCGFLPFYAGGGSSTKNDVLRLFGEPLDRNSPDLSKANWWEYHYTYLGNLGVERAALEVYFKGDILKDYQLQVQDTRY